MKRQILAIMAAFGVSAQAATTIALNWFAEAEHGGFYAAQAAGLYKAAGLEVRGVSDHGFIRSIYFRDPNGYVIELTAKLPGHDEAMNPATNGARAKLDRWTAARAAD